ncbi:DUF3782 domain-containing protein [Pseudanabaena galeata UHCC 0370]|uniref:DUF3782 domain-containing protein n=1 Tax=Pseudanabaena galeata UHCC 0370 TaxID=3110310 RepID=A0ABU5TTB9_9CYAN|nr:DUF3782 domain-containing protein [Pseudanabaena galeata]MEA5480718.1 DUF3782 domain-containing protein [Pseudanabaena galeata UHCC 0370]
MSDNTITLDDIFALFRESEQQRQEYQHQAELEMAELRKTIEQTNKQIEQTNKQVGGLTSRWAEFVENLIKPAAARIFREQGIDVHYTAMRVKGDDDRGSMEIDILVENSNEIVAIEVKSHLEVRDIKRFLQTLERFKEAFPKYQNYKLYGAVAGIKIDERSDLFATQEGLFVIAPAGDSVIIANSQILEPRIW